MPGWSAGKYNNGYRSNNFNECQGDLLENIVIVIIGIILMNVGDLLENIIMVIVGTILMNVGDLLENITAGRFQATRHRVRIPEVIFSINVWRTGSDVR